LSDQKNFIIGVTEKIVTVRLKLVAALWVVHELDICFIRILMM